MGIFSFSASRVKKEKSLDRAGSEMTRSRSMPRSARRR
jgi:hypothetical protein